jgi:hypothetical protein
MPELPAGILWMRVGVQVMAVDQGQIRMVVTDMADTQLRRPVTGRRLAAICCCQEVAKLADGCSDEEVMATRWIN